MHRLFIAIDLTEEIKAQLAELCSGLPGAHWVPSEQLHLTLRFIGDTDDRLLAHLKDELTAIRLPPFTLSLQRIGCFPSPQRPRVVWTGIQGEATLFQLATAVERVVTAAGLPAEQRPFTPHITLGRLKETKPAEFAVFQTQHAALHSPPFTVNEFHLYSSLLTRNGAIHRREQTYLLVNNGRS